MLAPVAGLAFGAASLDVGAIIRLGDVFASVMTGNLILLGLAVANKSSALLGHAGVSIISYCIGVTLSARIIHPREISDTGWPAAVTKALFMELAALIMFGLGWYWTASHPEGLVQIVMLALAALGMGIQSSAVRYLPRKIATTYLTGTLTDIIMGLAATINGRGRPKLRDQFPDYHFGLVAVCSAIIGAITAGLVMSFYPLLLPVLPLTAISGTTLLVSIRTIH